MGGVCNEEEWAESIMRKNSNILKQQLCMENYGITHDELYDDINSVDNQHKSCDLIQSHGSMVRTV